jgi:8-oxo-dGTP diphosphatase
MSKIVICVDIEGKTYETPVSELQWRPSAYGIVIKDNKILLSRQFGDKFDLPGGGLDLGEAPEAGVIREVEEETGIKVKDPRLLAVKNSFFQTAHAENKPYHCLMFYYSCEYVGGKLSIEGFDDWEKKYAEMAEWVPLNTLDKIKVASSIDYRPFIKKALEAK